MKRKFITLIILGLVFPGIMAGISITGCVSSATEYFIPGTYETTGQGYRGTIRIRVYISEGGIEDIDILPNNEDRHAVEAMEELRELALEMNSADLDAISGATVSSRAFLSALEAALAWAAE